MTTSPKTYTGKDASLWISGVTHTTLGISDFSLTLDRGTVEQELVGETGNYFAAGSLSATISLTHCKLDNTSAAGLLSSTINGTNVYVSGNCGADSLHFYFVSCAVTGFDISIGDADTITEGSVDLLVMTPYDISSQSGKGLFTGEYITNT